MVKLVFSAGWAALLFIQGFLLLNTSPTVFEKPLSGFNIIGYGFVAWGLYNLWKVQKI